MLAVVGTQAALHTNTLKTLNAFLTALALLVILTLFTTLAGLTTIALCTDIIRGEWANININTVITCTSDKIINPFAYHSTAINPFGNKYRLIMTAVHSIHEELVSAYI